VTGTITRVAQFFVAKCLPRTAYPVVKGPLRGSRFILGALAGEGGGSRVYLDLLEPEQTSAFRTSLRPGHVCFDIGANVGYYTILASRLVGPRGRVFAFEPLVRNVAYLYRHVYLNRADNVTIVPAACSDALRLASFLPGDNVAVGHLVGEENGSGVPVVTVAVDQIVELTGVVPNVLKIDVEGAELSVLRGASDTLAAARPIVFLSTHSAGLRGECLDLLQNHGYRSTPLGAHATDASEFLVTPLP
jgi:FkbM family methyltransferase